LIRRVVPLMIFVVGAVSAVFLPAALGGGAATPAVVGNVASGKKLFVSQACAACHTMKAAKATGTIGPNLDTLKPPYAKIVAQITIGGKSVMGKAAAKYTVSMKSYKGILSTAKIQDIAAYVYASTSGTSAATTTGSTATTSGTTTTAKAATTPTTTTTAKAATTTTSGGGVVGDGCPPGQTIVSLGADDHDEDDAGGPTDGDGCV
jgi:mono/diheme cytochrome c family protein